MKKFFFYVSALIFCLIAGISYSQSLRSVNFQGAGWVTAVKYTTNGARLYARTDVGGVFRSDNGGALWSFISNYAVTLSGLFVQGLVIHPADNNTVYIACGSSYRNTDPGMGVWKTTDGGNSWTHILQNVNFSGNDDIRWGGECIALDPVNPEIIYAGGRESGIYKSSNGGSTWTLIPASNIITGNISTITIRPGTSGNTAEIWAGSEGYVSGNAGVWRSLNGGTSWTQLRSSADVENVVFRITVKTDGTAFVAYNESIQKYTPAGGSWAVIPGFTSGAGSLAAVHFMGSENKIIASRMNYTKLSTDGGLNFNQVLPMTVLGPLPKHSYNWTVVDWARNHFQQNPSNANEWYMSGGFGCLKSTDAGQNWRYATDGINIPVMYRTHFHLTNPNYVFLPMGDLTMGRITDGEASGELTDYAFYSFSVLQDFSNATAVLTTSANPNKQYIVGGNIYAGEISGIFVTTNNGANYTKVIVNGLPTSTGRPIVNGIASDANENQLIVYIGGDYSNIGTTGGIYWSSNGGQNFTRANGLSSNIIAPNTFYEYYGLAKDPFNTSKRYGYFEGDGGGFYESGDEGKNWSLKSNIFAGYKPSGGLCVHPTVQNLFYAAIGYYGLYKTTDGGSTWNNMNGWESAEQVDSRSNIITAFGMRTGDTYNKIYKSTNNGNTWDVLNTGQFKLPNTTSLVINPHNNDQLWIGTTGNGTFIYDGLTIGIQNISAEIPVGFKIYQNYPNPFNPTTKIKFEVPSHLSFPNASIGNPLVTLKVYDMLGRELATLVNEELAPGTYSVDWNASDVPSGIYFYKMTSGNFTQTKKMLLIK
jgi:photosystem II stability/assembly factor-like uncharacterized protein